MTKPKKGLEYERKGNCIRFPFGRGGGEGRLVEVVLANYHPPKGEIDKLTPRDIFQCFEIKSIADEDGRKISISGIRRRVAEILLDYERRKKEGN